MCFLHVLFCTVSVRETKLWLTCSVRSRQNRKTLVRSITSKWGIRGGTGANLVLSRIPLLQPKRHNKDQALFLPSFSFHHEQKLFKLKDYWFSVTPTLKWLDKKLYKTEMKFWMVLGRQDCREKKKELRTAISMQLFWNIFFNLSWTFFF